MCLLFLPRGLWSPRHDNTPDKENDQHVEIQPKAWKGRRSLPPLIQGSFSFQEFVIWNPGEERGASCYLTLQYLWCTFLQSTSSLIILPIATHFSSFYSLIGIIRRKRCRPVVRAQQHYYWNSKIIDTNTKTKHNRKWLKRNCSPEKDIWVNAWRSYWNCMGMFPAGWLH